MSAEVGVHWRPIVSSCNSPSGTQNASTTSLPPLPDLIPIKKSQKCYDRLFKTENSACHIETSCSSSCSGSSTATSLCGNVSSGETPSSVKQAGSNERTSVWSTAAKSSTADCYEFVDELEFDDFNDGISTTNTSFASLNSTRNTKTKCNSGGKKRQAYNPFVPLYTGNSNNCNSVGARTNTKVSAKDEIFVLKQERGETSEVSDSLLSDDVKKEKHRRSRRNNTHTQQQNTFTSADTVHPIDYRDTDVFDADESKSRDVSSCIDNRSNCNVSTLYDDANDLNDDDAYANENANHYTNEMHTKAIRAVNKNKAQQKHRKTGRRKQTKKRKPVRQSKTNSIKKTQQFTYQSNKFNNCRNNNNNSLSVPRVNPIFLWVKQDDTTIVEVRCEDYDKRNRIRLTKTSNGWKAIPRTEKSFLLPPSNLGHLHRSDEGSTSNVVDTEEETRKKVHKKHKRKKKKHKKERVDSVDSTREHTDTTTTTEIELKVPPIIVNIKQEAVEKRAYATKRINDSEESKVIKVEALEPREPAVQCHNGTYDEARSFPEEFDNIEAHIPSHTISLAAINKDRYVHAHVSHNNNNNNDFISELGFNHQESQENTCIEKPIPNDISSAYHHRIVEASCGGNSESMSMSNTNSILGASPTPILIPSPPLVSNIEHEHEHETPPSASLFAQTPTLENTRVRNVVACSTQTMACMESSISSVPVARMEMHSNDDGGENRKVHSLQLPNNNNSICETRLLDESGAACNNIQQQQGVLRGTKDASTTSSISNMCPDSAPPTAVYETLKREVAECIENTEHLLSENNKENVLHFSENKHLSDYPDCSELINEICDIQNAATHDLMSQHCDNTMTGAELLDSLIEQRCEDNHISGADDDVKNSIYTISDDYNDEDDLLLNQAPVSDILSRLNETLSSAPKCLSFNEAGEIEGLHGDLFDTAHNPLNTMEDNMANPFSQNTGLDDLSLTIKNLTSNSDSEFSDSRKESDSSKDCNNSNQSITILSADSGEEEIPKDLTCKKQENEASASIVNQKKSVSHSPRPVSHSSDTIQSPQPSGLPAVPPSPELFPSNNNSKNQSNSNSTKLFIESILASPKRTSSEAQQKEPLNLGKCRKSASPTVSCSEEIKKSHAMEPVVISDDEPSKKRMKKETKDKEVIDVDKLPNPETARLLELLTSGNDPDPLTQFRLLISNPAWKVPDPLLVPKDRLNAVLASPAREIPLLLTTRPELRLPEAFAFPAILQDPDILVISLTQLERILHNQDELLKAKAKATEKEGDVKKALESPKNSSVPKSDNPVETPENANDMTAAMSMFNQMLWLPYLQQMGQFNPEMIKRMMGLQAPSMPDMLSLMSQNRFNDFSMPNPMDYKRQIEAAMWQEAMANDANLQRAMKIKADSQKKAHEAKTSAASKSQENARTLAAAQAQSKLNQMMNPLNPLTGMPPFMQPTLANQRFFQQQQAAQLRNQLTSQQAASQLQAAYNASAYNKQSVNSHHANSRSQQSPNQKKTSANNLLNQNPFLQVPNNFQEFHEQQQQLARRLQKEKDHHLKQQQQMQQDSKPRVTCKSLSNLMQPPRNATQADLAMFGHTNMSKMSNLMAMPGINMHPGASSSSSSQSASSSHSQQQMHNAHLHHSQQSHHQQQAKLKVKPGLSLLDPAALQRRLLSNEDDIGGGAVNLEESPDMASPLWHPLFGNQQKSSYNSPWNWTTVTASGE